MNPIAYPTIVATPSAGAGAPAVISVGVITTTTFPLPATIATTVSRWMEGGAIFSAGGRNHRSTGRGVRATARAVAKVKVLQKRARDMGRGGVRVFGGTQ